MSGGSSQFQLSSTPVAAHFIGHVVLFATADGKVAAVTRQVGIEGMDVVHESGMLFAAASEDKKELLTVGEDGVVKRITLEKIETIEQKFKSWPTAFATGPDGSFALAHQKKITVVQNAKAITEFATERMVQGLSFAPKGFRLAACYADAVSLIWANRKEAPPETLVWKGAHLSCLFSPDGNYLITTMQENALHGWRLSDKAHMRMTGYPAKPRSLSWSPKGRWLASSGAQAAILWPFVTKDGPMGKPPNEVAPRACNVTTVAFHPKMDVLAIGYEDGAVILLRTEDNAELQIAEAAGAPNALLAWSSDGTMFAWADEAGRAGLFCVHSI